MWVAGKSGVWNEWIREILKPTLTPCSAAIQRSRLAGG